jgi:hypothetical protein
MKRTKVQQFTPEVCECCGQDTSYELGLDKGTALIVYQIAKFIRMKGINIVHPRKEMEGVYLTSNQVGNLSRARFHGLIASVDDNAGNYLLTKKGGAFLRGEVVPKIAIVKKATAKLPAMNIGYHLPDEIKTTFRGLVAEKEYWTGIDFEIKEGRVVLDIQEKATLF